MRTVEQEERRSKQIRASKTYKNWFTLQSEHHLSIPQLRAVKTMIDNSSKFRGAAQSAYVGFVIDEIDQYLRDLPQ